ncbi:FtsW/RodA/SpoVE family cell cycle protein, partial [Bacillus thuringiensis]
MKKVLKLVDYSLAVSLIITVLFGILMMYSASSIIAIKYYGYDSDFFFRSQLNKLFIGIIGLIICVGIPFHLWKKRIISVCIVV